MKKCEDCEMEIGDKVIANGSVGIIVEKFNGNRGDYKTGWDWEVAFITNPPMNCWLDCYKKEDLTLYKWLDYPKTFMEKLKLLWTTLLDMPTATKSADTRVFTNGG